MFSLFANNLVGQKMFSILDKCSELEKKGHKVIHYELGDPDFETDYSIKESLIDALKTNQTHYTSSQGLPELISKIVSVEKKHFKKLEYNNIQVCVANSAIFYSMICLLNTRESVMLPKPYFPTYFAASNFLNLKKCYYELKFENYFKPDVQKIIDYLNKYKVKLLIINNPSNPTGVKYDYEIISDLIKYCQNKNITIFFEEVYFKTVFEGSKETILSSIKSLKNIIILRSFSKEYFMTGWRIGYLIGDQDIINKIKLTNETIMSCLPTFIQSAAIRALEQDYEKKYSKFHEIIKSRRDLLYEGLSSISGIEVVKPNSSFYIFPKINKKFKNINHFANILLEKYKIAISPGDIFGDTCKKNFRMCYASVNNNDLIKTVNVIENMFK